MKIRIIEYSDTRHPEILLHPNIPKPLHGINPRTVLGEDWWNTERQKVYKSTDYHCAACGIHKTKAKYHKWLEAHECYNYDYKNGILTYKNSFPLCHSCHNYIHSGRMNILLDSGEMSYEKYQDIRTHGDALVKELIPKGIGKNSVAWKDWRMIINGKAYGPSSVSHEAWERGEWKKWKPCYDK